MARVGKRPPLRRGKVSPCRPVPEHIPRPPYVGSPTIPEISRDYQMHDSKGIYRMRAACALAAQVLDYAGTLVKVRFLDLHSLQKLTDFVGLSCTIYKVSHLCAYV